MVATFRRRERALENLTEVIKYSGWDDPKCNNMFGLGVKYEKKEELADRKGPAVARIKDALCQVLEDQDGSMEVKLGCERSNVKFCTAVVRVLEAVGAMDALPVVRQAVMKDLIDLDYWGGWGNILGNVFKRSATSKVDVLLASRTAKVREGRRQWQMRRNSWGTRETLRSNDSKCTFFYCDELETPETPHPFRCDTCRVAHYCSRRCASMDPHDRACENEPRHEDLWGQDEATSITTVAVMKRKCDNCERLERWKGEFQACGKCKRVVYCGAFCQQYGWKRGTHRALCKQSIG